MVFVACVNSEAHCTATDIRTVGPKCFTCGIAPVALGRLMGVWGPKRGCHGLPANTRASFPSLVLLFVVGVL